MVENLVEKMVIEVDIRDGRIETGRDLHKLNAYINDALISMYSAGKISAGEGTSKSFQYDDVDGEPVQGQIRIAFA